MIETWLEEAVEYSKNIDQQEFQEILSKTDLSCTRCGTCCIIPKLLFVNKPPHTRCQHLRDDNTCAIHYAKPEPCQNFPYMGIAVASGTSTKSYLVLWNCSQVLVGALSAYAGERGMKILFFTDPHNSDTPPRMRLASYREDILKKQEALIEPAKKCDMVICGGDIYHQKKPERVSHKLVNQIAELYREFPLVHIVAGNHDYDTNVEELRYNPLATLGKLPNVYVTGGSCHTLRAGIVLCYVGMGDYHSFAYIKKYLEDWQRTRHNAFSVAVLHAPVSHKKHKFPTLNTKEIEEYADLFLLGHIHDLQKVSVHNKIVAPGALSRGVLKLDESLNREVGYVTVEINLGSSAFDVEFVKLKVKKPDDIFRMEEKSETMKKAAAVSSFVEYIQGKFAVPKTLNKEALMQQIKTSDIDKKTKREALRILGGA